MWARRQGRLGSLAIGATAVLADFSSILLLGIAEVTTQLPLKAGVAGLNAKKVYKNDVNDDHEICTVNGV